MEGEKMTYDTIKGKAQLIVQVLMLKTKTFHHTQHTCTGYDTEHGWTGYNTEHGWTLVNSEFVI